MRGLDWLCLWYFFVKIVSTISIRGKFPHVRSANEDPVRVRVRVRWRGIMPTIGVIPRVLFEGPRMESDRLYRTVVGRSLSNAERRAWIRLEKWVRSEKWSRSTAWSSCSWESDTCYTRNHFTANAASVNVPCFREILRNGPETLFTSPSSMCYIRT